VPGGASGPARTTLGRPGDIRRVTAFPSEFFSLVPGGFAQDKWRWLENLTPGQPVVPISPPVNKPTGKKVGRPPSKNKTMAPPGHKPRRLVLPDAPPPWLGQATLAKLQRKPRPKQRRRSRTRRPRKRPEARSGLVRRRRAARCPRSADSPGAPCRFRLRKPAALAHPTSP